MAFGRSAQSKQAEGQNQQIAQTAVNNSTNEMGAGTDLLNKGAQNLQTGTNFFNAVLGGNRDASTAALAPDINRIRDSNQQALTATNTLMPRGGGRTASLFGRPLATNDAVNNMYTGLRSNAAQSLSSIGQGQQGQGANLFGIANGSLGTGAQTNAGILNYEQQQQQLQNQLYSGLGAGIGGLITAPLGGAGSPSLWGRIFNRG